MVSLLLIISFLLHITLIIAVYHLYQQLKVSKQSQEQELETLFANFLKEIRTENERLQSQLENEPYPINVAKRTQEPFNESQSVDKKNHFLPSLQNEKKDQLETSMESKIFSLYNQGKSVNDIAKILNRGKTEVALILKLHSNNAENT